MSEVVKFTEECQSLNQRLYAIQNELGRMVEERDILLNKARGAGVMISAAKLMIGKLTFTITMPEGFRPTDQPPAPTGEQPAEQAIVRHPDQAA